VKNPQAGEAAMLPKAAVLPLPNAQARVTAHQPARRELHTDDHREPGAGGRQDARAGRGTARARRRADRHRRRAAVDKEYLDALAFMEEPVTIRIEPSAGGQRRHDGGLLVQRQGRRGLDAHRQVAGAEHPARGPV
jgi:hypothetical protein